MKVTIKTTDTTEVTDLNILMEDLLALGSVTIEHNGKIYTIQIDERDYDQMRRSDYLR